VGLKHHPEARRELDEAIAWYEADYPGRGRRFADAFVTTERLVLAAPTASQRGVEGVTCVSPSSGISRTA
jgi:hypothetical protein